MKKYIPYLITFLLGGFLSLIWIGFLKPDPFFMERTSRVNLILFYWVPLVFIPVLFLLFSILILVKKKSLRKNIFSLLLAFVITGLLLYPVADYLYAKKQQADKLNAKSQFHPYLQLNPNYSANEDLKLSDDVYNIFCLGGSTTEFTNSEDIGWPQLLETRLNQLYQDSINVFNFGRQWYTSLHSLINYEANLRHYKPDAIIIMHNINDLIHNADFSYLSKGEFREDYGHFLGPNSNLFDQSGIAGNIISEFSKFRNFQGRSEIHQDIFPGLKSFSRYLNTIIDLAATDSTKVILLTQPHMCKAEMTEEEKNACYMVNFEAVGNDKRWSYETAYRGLSLYNEKIRDIASERGVILIDLENYIPKNLLYFADEVHYHDTTFKTINEVLSEMFFQSNYLDME